MRRIRRTRTEQTDLSGNSIHALAKNRARLIGVPMGHGTLAETDEPAQLALPIVHNTLLLAFCTTTGQYEPATHGTGAYADSPTLAQFAPSGHTVGIEVPATGQTLPLGHGAHAAAADWPILGLKVPAAHNTGIADTSGQYVPIGHGVPFTAPPGQYAPDGHTLGMDRLANGHANPTGQGNIPTAPV